jgi:phenylpyruvate tautomerase PptA (4-oxalocrotonate tautomerase family)
MPIMQVQHADGCLNSAQKADLATRLTDILIQMEGGANTHGGRAFAHVQFIAFKPDDWYVGGETGDGYVSLPGRFIIHVTIPEGYMNAQHKNEVHAWVNDAIVATTGAPKGEPNSILVVIDEVPEGNWGNSGKPISLSSIAKTVGLSHQDRVVWTKDYFAAKARAYAAADYPKDTGGLE